MRVVLDTNVLVSGLVSPGGTCRLVLDQVVTGGGCELIVDDRILCEYVRVLARPDLRIEVEEARRILVHVQETAMHVEVEPMGISLPDPDDAGFLEVAIQAGAALVTGNRRHFPASACRGVLILSPREFLDRFEGPGDR